MVQYGRCKSKAPSHADRVALFAGTFSNVAVSQTRIGAVVSIFEKLGAPENYGQTALYDALYHGIQHASGVLPVNRAQLRVGPSGPPIV